MIDILYEHAYNVADSFLITTRNEMVNRSSKPSHERHHDLKIEFTLKIRKF